MLRRWSACWYVNGCTAIDLAVNPCSNLHAFPLLHQTATFYWRDLIKDLLPAGSNGIDIVFSNPCNPSFTYQINGPNATFLGRGNLHETAFDGYGVESDLAELGSYFIRRR